MGFLSIAIGFLGNIFGNLLGNIFGIGGGGDLGGAVSSLGRQVSTLANNLTSLSKIITDGLKAIGAAFDAIWNFLKSIWDNYLKKFLEWLKDHLVKLYNWLHQHIKSLIDHLKKWKKWYDEHILPFQLKQIALIQHIRQILGILKAFHVKWAQTLDNKLADLQNRIVATIEITRGALNSIINFVGLIFDPSLLIRSTALGGSLLNMLGGLKRIAGFGSGLGITKAQASQMQKDQQMYTKTTVTANISTRAQTGLTPDDRQARSDFQSALSATTGVSL